MAAILFMRSEQKVVFLWTTIHTSFLLSLAEFGQVVSEEKIFENRPIKI